MCCGLSLRRTQLRDRACSSGFGVAVACAVCPFACTTDGKTRGRKLHWGRLSGTAAGADPAGAAGAASLGWCLSGCSQLQHYSCCRRSGLSQQQQYSCCCPWIARQPREVRSGCDAWRRHPNSQPTRQALRRTCLPDPASWPGRATTSQGPLYNISLILLAFRHARYRV